MPGKFPFRSSSPSNPHIEPHGSDPGEQPTDRSVLDRIEQKVDLVHQALSAENKEDVPKRSEMDVPKPNTWAPVYAGYDPATRTSLSLADSLPPMADRARAELQKTVVVKRVESETSDARRSPTMARFFQRARCYREAFSAIFTYLWHAQQFFVLVATLISLGAVAMTGGFYFAKEILYLVVIGLLAAKGIHSHWRNERKKEVAAILISISVLTFSGLLSWTEWQRHHESTILSSSGSDPTASIANTESQYPPKRIIYALKDGSNIDLSGAKVTAYNERSEFTYAGTISGVHRVITMNIPPGSYIITAVHSQYGTFQGEALLALDGKPIDALDADALITLEKKSP